MEGKDTKNEKEEEKILIRGVNWIGDAVMTLPAIRAIRKYYPRAHISLLVNPSVAPLFENSNDIDEIIIYEPGFRKLAGKLRLAKILRKKRFSRAILLQNAFDAALIAFLARIPERIGYDRDRRGFLLTAAIRYTNQDRNVHHIHYYLNLLTAAGIGGAYAHPWLRMTLQERLDVTFEAFGVEASYSRYKSWSYFRLIQEMATRAVRGGGGMVHQGDRGQRCNLRWKRRGHYG